MVIERVFLDIKVDSVADYGSNLILVTHVIKGAIAMSESKSGRGSLFAGGVAAILASACCLGPLILITLGISGAWIGNLAALEPYRPWFIGAALVAMVFAWRRIYRPAGACQPGDVCAVPQVRTAYKVVFWIVALLILTALAFPFVLPLFY
jgi:mercuric ion transport protein|tara:strand:- start:429 stop:881 length:453 start_codon:yes stop_codon:yes gene_type:complete